LAEAVVVEYDRFISNDMYVRTIARDEASIRIPPRQGPSIAARAPRPARKCATKMRTMKRDPDAVVKRRYDPDRRANIALAAMRIVTEVGVDNLSFRAVAEEADVPLGSLTYHYANKDELLIAAMQVAREQNREFLQRLLTGFEPEKDFPRAFSQMIVASSTEHRDQLVLDFEWIFATHRRLSLVDANHEWNADGLRLIERYTDPLTAQWLSTLLHGFLMESVNLGKRWSLAEVEPLVRGVIDVRTRATQ